MNNNNSITIDLSNLEMSNALDILSSVDFTDILLGEENMNPKNKETVYNTNLECVGCGTTLEELLIKEGWTDKDFDENSITTNYGNWYCHSDCLRDSR